MIWILLGYLLFSLFGGAPVGEAIEAVRDRAAEIVTDSDRAGRIENELDALTEALEASVTTFQAKEAAFLAALREPTTDPAALRTLLDEIHVERSKLQKRMIASRSRLKDAITREEWGQVFPPPAQK